MSGPIVRTGPSPEFTKNWGSVFGKKGKSSGASGKTTKSNKGAGGKTAKKKPAKKGGKK
ncbi:MAG: RNA polymerase subunit sigma [Planctomycetia bacterium]|nr:RNA polymerase subunit sigma [Planctomycetia bacterium]